MWRTHYGPLRPRSASSVPRAERADQRAEGAAAGDAAADVHVHAAVVRDAPQVPGEQVHEEPVPDPLGEPLRQQLVVEAGVVVLQVGAQHEAVVWPVPRHVDRGCLESAVMLQLGAVWQRRPSGPVSIRLSAMSTNASRDDHRCMTSPSRVSQRRAGRA